MKKKVLIVEDHADIRKLLRMTLEFSDFDIVDASNGDEAWRMAERLQPDIVLLDVMMPGHLNGLDVCRRIKASDELRHTRVVLLTALGSAEDRAAGRSAGADGYLVKPFSTLSVLEAIDQLESLA